MGNYSIQLKSFAFMFLTELIIVFVSNRIGDSGDVVEHDTSVYHDRDMKDAVNIFLWRSDKIVRVFAVRVAGFMATPINLHKNEKFEEILCCYCLQLSS
jgi:predicted GNAT family acetyltransferase